jgi:two-component system, chemotaxis family, response regulator Rcp1
MTKRAIKILWVEDNVGDILLIKESLQKVGLTNNLVVVNDGADAMDFLLRRSQFVHAELPDLVILDLNLPKKSGREVIAEIKVHPELSRIPLIILTTSSHDHDVLVGLDPNRSLYLVKPLTFAELLKLGALIEDFYHSVTSLKPPSHS